MNTYLKTIMLAALGAGLVASQAAVAKPTYLSAGAKARGNYGYGGASSSRSTMQARSYRAYQPAPTTVRSTPAPAVVAQAPTEQRSFSYEPSQQPVTARPCPGSVVREAAPETAQRSTQTDRSFSYEPAIEAASEPAVRSYSRPMTRDSQKPAYLLQKTDPRKYRSGR